MVKREPTLTEATTIFNRLVAGEYDTDALLAATSGDSAAPAAPATQTLTPWLRLNDPAVGLSDLNAAKVVAERVGARGQRLFVDDSPAADAVRLEINRLTTAGSLADGWCLVLLDSEDESKRGRVVRANVQGGALVDFNVNEPQNQFNCDNNNCLLVASDYFYEAA